jgi:acetoin utilization deacetylase AcuC-like enzyme
MPPLAGAHALKAFTSDRFVLPLPSGHRFPMAKYALLRERVGQALPQVRLFEPPAAAESELLLAHDAGYVRRVFAGALSASEQRAIGFPWSAEMVERSRRSVGATLAACTAAAADGVAVNLAGGTHHALRDRGQGYCVFNDVAIAALARCRGDGDARVAIIDLDVHQGDGTAAIVGASSRVFALSLHGSRNYPARKIDGHIDVGLDDGTGDAEYLAALDDALASMLERFVPTFIVYLAGADPHEGDRLGRLRLTFDGLVARDTRVFDLAARLGAPVAVTMGGGYGHDVGTTVQVHLNTVTAAFDHWRRCRPTAGLERQLG